MLASLQLCLALVYLMPTQLICSIDTFTHLHRTALPLRTGLFEARQTDLRCGHLTSASQDSTACQAHATHACDIYCACAGLSWGIYFTAYNNAKMRWQSARSESTLPAPLHLLSAAEAGCIVSSSAQIAFKYELASPACGHSMYHLLYSTSDDTPSAAQVTGE